MAALGELSRSVAVIRMAALGTGRRGRVIPLCPITSDVDLFCDGESVVDLYSEIADRALNLFMPQQKLYRAQVSSAAVDEGCFGSA